MIIAHDYITATIPTHHAYSSILIMDKAAGVMLVFNISHCCVDASKMPL